MIEIITSTLKEDGKNKVVLKCKQADTKPTTGIANASRAIAMDSGKTWFYDGDTSAWVVEKNAHWRRAIANAPTVNNDIGDELYDPNTSKAYMHNGTQFEEQFQMTEGE